MLGSQILELLEKKDRKTVRTQAELQAICHLRSYAG